MEYELENIESVVTKVLSLILSGRFRTEEFEKIKTFFSSEYRRIKTSFRRKVISGEGESCLKDYFVTHQIGLIEILDHTFEAYSSISSHKDGYNIVIEYLQEANENLLSLIRNEFSGYFNDNVRAPKSFIEKAQQDLSAKLDRLELISSNEYVEPQLIDPVISSFRKCLDGSDNALTFKQLHYLKLLQEEVCQIDFSINDLNWRRLNLCNVLIKLNFNDPNFFKFYTDHINKALLTCETLSDRIDQASYFYKAISQIAVIHGVGLHDSKLDVKQQSLEWISCELDYLHQKQRLQLSSKEAFQIKSDFKIIFDLSVSQLGYLFKIFIETGIIQNKNASEIIRFLAKFVKTKKAEFVSYESLRIKFYNTESGTKDAVRKTFQSLISYINKN